MEKSMIDIKNELIEWIENSFDLEILQKILDMKNGMESTSLIADINSETFNIDSAKEYLFLSCNKEESGTFYFSLFSELIKKLKF